MSELPRSSPLDQVPPPPFKLPEGWFCCFDSREREYYYFRQVGTETSPPQWDPPEGSVPVDQPEGGSPTPSNNSTTIQHPSSPHDLTITIPPTAAPQMAVGTAIPMPLGMPMLPNQDQLTEGTQKMIVATLKDRIVRAALNIVFFPRVSLLFFLIWLIPQLLVFIAEVVIAAAASCPNLTVYLGVDAGVTLLLSGCGFLLRHLLLEALRTKSPRARLLWILVLGWALTDRLFNFAIAVLGSTFLANPWFYTAPATNMTMVMTIYYWFVWGLVVAVAGLAGAAVVLGGPSLRKTLRAEFGLAVWQQGVAHMGVPLTPQAQKAAAAPMPLPDASVSLGAPIPAGPAPIATATADQSAIAAKV